MARIVCQVLDRGERTTFIWSQGTAAFEPYHLEGSERAALLESARRAHAALAADASAELPRLGHELFQAMFPARAAAVQAWLLGLMREQQIDKLEIVGDAPGLAPWNIVCEEPTAGFWGARFSLGVGRRVNVLRLNSAIVNPTQMAAVDLGVFEQLAPDQQALLGPLRDAGKLVHSTEALADELKKLSSDVLLIVGRFESGRLHLGADTLVAADLQAWIEEARDGNPDPVIILAGCGPAEQQGEWRALIEEMTARFAGLAANEALLPSGRAFGVAHSIAARLVQGAGSVGEIMRALRQAGGAAELAFSAFCPPQIRVVPEGSPADADPDLPPRVYPLPARPFRPFAACEIADRALFVGREADTLKGALLLDQARAAGVLVHGGPATGKTSYLQAGVLPALEYESIGYRTLRDRTSLESPEAEAGCPILILRATDDLAGQFADALWAYCARPYTYSTPSGTQVTVDLPRLLREGVAGRPMVSASSTAIQPGDPTGEPGQQDVEDLTPRDVWVALRDQPEFLAKILEAITSALPFELVIAIDQVDDLITLVQTPQQRSRRQKAIEMLGRLVAARGRVKLLLAVQSHHVAEFVDLFPERRLPAGVQTFALPALSEASLCEVLLRPTQRDNVLYADDAPARTYGFSWDEGVAQAVVADALEEAAEAEQSPLALVQAAGAWLHAKAVVQRKQNTIRSGDVTELGDVRHALMKHLELTLERLPIAKASRKALRGLIARLSLSQGDGAVGRALLPAEELGRDWPVGAEPATKVVGQAAEREGLFEIQELLIGGQAKTYVSLPQDSLAQLGRTIARERDRDAYAQTRVVDMLWIMVPLVFLAAAVTFWFTRNFVAGESGPEDGDKTKELREALLESERDKRAMMFGTRGFLYQGLLAQADQAVRMDNALRARELLLSQPAMRSFNEEKQFKLADPRGFAWRYLWRNLNSERWRLEGHRGVVRGVAISPDGKLAASCSAAVASIKDDSAIRLWDLQTGKLLAKAPGPQTTVFAVAFAPDGKTLASAGADKLVRLWDVSQGSLKLLKTLAGHEGAVHAVAFGKDAETLASAGADQAVILWDVVLQKPRHVLKEHAEPVAALIYVDDGKTLVSAGAGPSMILWDVAAAKKKNAVKSPFQAIAALAAAPDGKSFGAGGVESKLDVELGVIRAYGLDGKETHKPIHHSAGVLALAFSSDGSAIASGGRDHIVRLHDLASGAEKRKWIGHLGAVDALAFAKDGSTLLSGSHDQLVKAWDSARSSGPTVISAHDDWVQALALNPKATLLASGSRDGTVKLWNPHGKLLAELPKLPGAVTSLAFSHHKEKTYLAAGTRDEKNQGEIKIWEITLDAKQAAQAELKHTLAGHAKGIAALAFCPSAALADVLVSGGADKNVKAWNVQTGKETKNWAAHADEVRCLAFADDGQTFASGGRDRRVCLFNLDRADFVILSEVHLGSIEAIAISPDKTGSDDPRPLFRLITGSTDQSIRLWAIDPEDKTSPRTEAGIFRTHVQPVSGLVYDNAAFGTLVSSSWDGTIKLFDRQQERFTLVGHRGPVRAIALAPDQSFVASAGNDGTIRIWRAAAIAKAK